MDGDLAADSGNAAASLSTHFDALQDPAPFVMGALTALEALNLAVRRVRDLHRPSRDDDGTCGEDGKPWPCPTQTALETPAL